MRRILLLIFALSAILALSAQSNLNINGLNEAQFIYRDAADSLNIYFKDSFAMNLAYKDFGFGMKFIAELPKYSTNQSELVGDMAPADLKLAWEELYLSYEQGPWMARGGTLYETFGSGLVFRSYEDKEFDLDHRLSGFHFRYDDAIRIKALYGANASPLNDNALDLSYGLDLEYPLDFFTLGAAAVGYRNLTPFNNYSQTDIFSGRLGINQGPFSAKAEYASRELYKRGNTALGPISGSAIYASADLSLGPVLLGVAYKNYDQFQFRQQDVPLANYHGETLADNQASALDEIGLQGWSNVAINDSWSLDLNYAEAWNQDESKRMNDAYAALEYSGDALSGGLSWSHVEKTGSDLNGLGQSISYWQREITPAFHANFPAWGKALGLTGEFKQVDKENLDATAGDYVLKGHYEPKLQADIALGKVSLSLGAQSEWEDFSAIMESRYWANAEARISLFDHSDILVFAGREAGGKVCRNGMCRYVAPFSGLRVELATRF